jgi:signal transduction histidine kinase
MVESGSTVGSSSFSEEDLREMVLRLAHEIRNPLATIKSGVQLIQHLEKPEGPVATTLHSVLEQVTRIDRTVQDMQRLIKVAPGNPLAVQVRTAVEDAVAQRNPTARRQGVALTVAGGPPATIVVDPSNLGTALDELLSNAISISPAGSTVMVSWLAGGGEVAIHVDDEGPGVARDAQERIGRPFFSTSTQGSGLGLAITVRICQAADGRLAWRNLAGRGCRFTLVLPEG